MHTHSFTHECFALGACLVPIVVTVTDTQSWFRSTRLTWSSMSSMVFILQYICYIVITLYQYILINDCAYIIVSIILVHVIIQQCPKIPHMQLGCELLLA